MDFIKEILQNYFFISPVLGWIAACIFKAILTSIKKKKKFSIKDGFINGGMPSTHTAFVTNITAAIGLVQGLTPLFYACLMFSLVVISDSFGVRKNIGIQGEVLNQLLLNLKKNPISVVYGHSFMQVLAGAIWGIGSAILFYFLLI